MTEVLPNIHGIQSVFDERLLTSYLLVGDRAMLIDSGLAYTPQETILPYLQEIALPLEKICWLVVTHASGDHYGGNGVLKERAPGIRIAAHMLDAADIASHDQFIKEHIAALGIDGIPVPDIQVDDEDFLALNGAETAVDWVVQGSERLRLSAGWPVVLIHTPGHTPGHLSVYEPVQRALFCGDAIMGAGVPDVSGRLVMPPHYFDVNQYLGTIESARLLNLKYIFLTHYPPIIHSEVAKFLDTSQAFVMGFQTLMVDVLNHAQNPLNISDIIPLAQESLGIPDSEYQYGLLIRAHLRTLVNLGFADESVKNNIPHWTIAE
jgi:glyoxylase-like metal-dependent hydrolase (beta-lactamase superfamily II)